MKQTLLSALKVAGDTLTKHFEKVTDYKIKESHSSIVTEADIQSDNLTVKFISEQYPTHNIISEESGFRNMNSKYTWVIDPLDGTSNFAAGIPWFGVLITLFEYNLPVMGGAYLPIQDIVYFAEKGQGAYRNGDPFYMNKKANIKESLFAFSIDYTDDNEILNNSVKIYLNLIKHVRNIRSTNSLIDFLYVAEGKLGGCINLFTRIWDISAPALILAESGSKLTDINGKYQDFKLSNDIIERNFPVIAGSESIIKEVMNKIL